MQLYVLDASALLTSVLNPKSAASKLIPDLLNQASKGKCEVYTTPLFIYEFSNGLRFSLSDSSLSAEVYEKFLHLPIKVFQLPDNRFNEVLNLSYQYKTTVYDTSYYMAAILLNATLLTCDKKFFDQVGDKDTIKLLTI